MDKGKIVVVDDDADIRDSLKEILQAKDYAVLVAANRKEGMETIKTEDPELSQSLQGWGGGRRVLRLTVSPLDGGGFPQLPEIRCVRILHQWTCLWVVRKRIGSRFKRRMSGTMTVRRRHS